MCLCHLASATLRGSGSSIRVLMPEDEVSLEGQPCALDNAVTLSEEIDVTKEWAEACSVAAESTRDTVQTVVDAIEYVRNFSNETLSLLEALDKVENFVNRFSVFTDKIPKIGKVIKKIRETLQKFLDKVRKVVDKFDDKLEVGQGKLENVTNYLEKLENFTGKASETLGEFGSVLNTAVSCSSRLGCAADGVINGVAAEIPTQPLFISQASFEACTLALSPLETIGLAVDLPDLVFLQELRKAINEIEAWIDAAIGDVVDGATYALCCDNVLRTVGDILENFSKISDLATCWVDPGIDSVKDLGIAGLFAIFDTIVSDSVNKIFEDTLPILVLIRKLEFSAETVTVPALTINEDTCELEFDDEDTWTVNTTKTFGVKFDVPDSIGDLIDLAGDVDDAASIGSQIAESCQDAINAFEDDGSADCCDVARTCDPEDRIVLYEGPDCSQNIAGTLSLPVAGQRTATKASDQICTANDESKSVRFNGPMEAGTVIEIGDNPDDFCRDDYTAIVLTKSLAQGESVCVGSFETANDKIRDIKTEYIIYHQRLNGLNGKASRYSVHNPGSNDSDFKPQCIKPVQLFEGNSCTQDVVSLMEVPNSGEKVYQGNDHFTNDEARSMKLVGPLPAGVRMELFDGFDENCRDDYSSIVVTTALEDYEEICITSFERDGSNAKTTQTYVPHNGLDGKVSRFQIWNSGNLAPKLTCRQAKDGEACGDDNDCLNGFCGRDICSSGQPGAKC
ncbi:MAG: hypothetical protein SGILL_001847, partial [Bacillariaceae sp.]